jgi:hypothetical protein
MTQGWVLLIVFATLLVTFTGIVARARGERRGPFGGVIVGAVCGLVAAFVIVQPRLDMVPDELEPLGVLAIIVIVSLGLIMLTWRRWMRD